MNKIFIFSLLTLLLIQNSAALDCLDYQGNSIDWYAAVNFPGKVQTAQPASDRKYFMYYDINSDASNQASFTLGDNFIDTNVSAVYYTLNQLSQNTNYEIIAWNDGDPNNSTYIFTTGHTKAVLALDLTTQTGFFLSHSMPNFPDITNNQISPIVPSTAKVYGQSFFCMSVTQDTLEAMAKQLIIENPRVYYTQALSESTPNLYAIGQLNNDTKSVESESKTSSSDLLQQMDITLRLNNTQVTVFTKSQQATGHFIFEDLIAPSLNVSLNVESWGRPWMAPNCSMANGLYTTNIQDVQVNTNIYWSSYNDHSKWITSVDTTQPYICIGDMNRMTSQNVRGGSFFCQKNANLYKVFNSVIQQVDTSCNSSVTTTATDHVQNNQKFLQ